MPRDLEGWDGKSIRRHVESAENTAAHALEVAEEARVLVGDLQEDMGEIRQENAELRQDLTALQKRVADLGKLRVVPNE